MSFHWIIGISIVICIGAVSGQLPAVLSDDDDPLLLKVILELTDTIKTMTTGLSKQRSETRALTDALLNCEACQAPRPKATPPPRPPGFCDATPPPCYPGVHCQEDEDLGFRCGACPSGYVGDGRSCRAATRTCADRPCYVSVQCYDAPTGFRCGPCPSGYDGDGQTCTRRAACQTKACYGNDGQYIGDSSIRSTAGSRRRTFEI